MNSYIKGIAIFKDFTKEGKRFVELSRGLNIITGHSKTGKSAILDIIDWCLGSEESTIPRGIITDFAQCYALILDIKETSLLIARREGEEGKNSIHVRTISNTQSIENITYTDIHDDAFFNKKHAFSIINNVINGITSPQLKLNKEPQLTIRDSLCFIFQHQDVIDSKTKLFYREPKKTYFPVLAGWYDNNYYLISSQIKQLDNSFKKQTELCKKAISENEKLENNYKNALRTYYNLIGVEFSENWDIQMCLDRAKKLEPFKREVSSNNIINRQEDLEKLMEKLQSEEITLDGQLKKIRINQGHGKSYKLFLEKFKEREKYLPINNDNVCPICNQYVNAMCIEGIDILEAHNWVKEELVSVPVKNHELEESFQEINNRYKAVVNELKKYKAEFIKNKSLLKEIKDKNNINEIKELARLRVLSEAEIYQNRHIPFDEKGYLRTQKELEKFRGLKKQYQESELYEYAKDYIENRMNLIVVKLDFEHNPADLHFELNPHKNNSYKLFQKMWNNDEQIYLRQMGSASNALACHIGLFLSFMNYFSSQKNSRVPSILFFDQPSQVYFPSGKDNTDIEKVSQIYSTILDEIEEIENNTGYTPQIIIADHIKDLGDNNVKLYEHYFKADWREGKALI